MHQRDATEQEQQLTVAEVTTSFRMLAIPESQVKGVVEVLNLSLQAIATASLTPEQEEAAAFLWRWAAHQAYSGKKPKS